MFFPVLSFLQSVFMLLIIYVIEEVKVTCEKIIYNFIKSKSVAIFIYFFIQKETITIKQTLMNLGF